MSRRGRYPELVHESEDIRQAVGRILEHRTEAVVNDAASLLRLSGDDAPDEELSRQLGELVVHVLMTGVRGEDIDPRSGAVTTLRKLARERRVSTRQLFQLVYFAERAALDELAIDESFGATSEPWPAIAQLVRRSSIDVLAAFATRLSQEAGEDALIDPLTTLHTRAVLLTALEKEMQRAERSNHPFALIVFDIDRLQAINDAHGYGFGDRVIERIGIVLRKYFREQDWVARSESDAFAVLLPETSRDPAMHLAELVRQTVEQRMALRDYRTDEQVTVTVTAAVLVAEAIDAGMRAEDLLREAEQAVHRAKHDGRNRVERIVIDAKTAPPPPRGSGLPT